MKYGIVQKECWGLVLHTQLLLLGQSWPSGYFASHISPWWEGERCHRWEMSCLAPNAICWQLLCSSCSRCLLGQQGVSESQQVGAALPACAAGTAQLCTGSSTWPFQLCHGTTAWIPAAGAGGAAAARWGRQLLPWAVEVGWSLCCWGGLSQRVSKPRSSCYSCWGQTTLQGI